MVFIHAKQDIARGVYQAASDHGMNLIVGLNSVDGMECSVVSCSHIVAW